MNARFTLSLALFSLVATACNPTTDNLNAPDLTPVFTVAYDLSEVPRSTDSTYFGLVWVKYTEDGPVVRLGGVLPSGSGTQGELDIFGPPPAAMLHEIGAATVGLGFIVLLEDRNEDGWFAFEGSRLMGPDTMVGIAFDQLLVYVDDPFGEVGSLISSPAKLTDGYHLGRTVCGEQSDTIEIAGADEKMSVQIFGPDSVLPETCTNFGF